MVLVYSNLCLLKKQQKSNSDACPKKSARCKGLGREKERERKNRRRKKQREREREREIEREGLDEANAISKELLHEVKGSLPIQKELKGRISNACPPKKRQMQREAKGGI